MVYGKTRNSALVSLTFKKLSLIYAKIVIGCGVNSMRYGTSDSCSRYG